MSPDKLQSIIARKNDRLEQEAVSRATEIIDEISEHQQAIIDSTSAIARLRKELIDLQIQQIDPVSILG